ncbi:hypothetical protein N8198_00725 [Gammaproteobacteria bacterium]|nr:hypothetical protein [Gammaproteobacteria bacterium]
MIKTLSRCLIISGIVFFAGLTILAIPSFFDPEFEIKNASPGIVSVVAIWRGNEKYIGEIQPMSSYIFSISDEAGIKFRVTYADKKTIESKETYFTSGIKIITIITVDAVEVTYDFAT